MKMRSVTLLPSLKIRLEYKFQFQCYSLFLQLLDVRFIEYMPFDGNKWSTKKFVPYHSMLAAVMARWPRLQRLQDSPNDTSKVSKRL